MDGPEQAKATTGQDAHRVLAGDDLSGAPKATTQQRGSHAKRRVVKDMWYNNKNKEGAITNDRLS